jgi:type I restriction enzyme S subunit
VREAGPPIAIDPAEWTIVRAVLARHVPGREVWAFGSRARRTARRHSDLDLAVIAVAPIPNAVLAAMAEDFSNSDLPWKVDVLD